MRNPKPIRWWIVELQYIRAIERDIAEGKGPGADFGHDVERFERYRDMQFRFCRIDGFGDML